MNTTLWIIVALVIGNLAATYVTSKIDMYIMNKAWSEYGCDDILIRFKSRFLGLSFITACAVLWPIAYPAITIRAYVKYKKAKKNYLKNLENQMKIEALLEKWQKEKVAC